MKNANNNRLLMDIAEKLIYNDGVNNYTLVQFIELCGNALNLETISDYSKRTGMSYNGVKKGREIVKLFGVRFVIDNE